MNQKLELTEEQVVGTYVLDKDANVLKSLKDEIQEDPVIEILPDHTFIARNFIDFDQDVESYSGIKGKWKLELSSDYEPYHVMYMNFENGLPSGNYLISNKDGIKISQPIGDPDSCEGVVYRKNE